MKKLLTVLLVVVALATTATAQDLINWNNVSYGLKGGLNYTNVAKEAEALIGFELGCCADYAMDQDLSLNVALLYATAGAKFDGGDLKLGYIKVPVNVAYKIAPEIKLYGGVYGAYNITSTFDGNDYKDNTAGLDYGIQIGGNYAIDQFVIDANYSIGLKDITGSGRQNSAITVGAGYKLDI